LHGDKLFQLKYAKISSPQNGGIKRGVIFATYSSLISESQNASTKIKYNSRMKQLIQWLGGEEFDGVVSADYTECVKVEAMMSRRKHTHSLLSDSSNLSLLLDCVR
jgi:hypothetical protein